MKNIFNTDIQHHITEANTNFYATPFIHPKRTMKEHDFIYVLSGEWKFGQNDEVFELKKDSLLILSANHKHFGLSPCLPSTKTMYFHVSCEDGDLSADTLDFKKYGNDIIDSLTDASLNRSVKKIFYDIVSSKLAGHDKKADILFNLLLCELSAQNTHTDSGQIGEKIKKTIHKSPERFFSNAQLAELNGVSVKTAETKFKALFGITIHQYMLKFKAEQAMSYLKNFPEMSIKEIAYNLGFYDEYHFSKQFKSYCGISPSAFRKKNL